MAPSISPLPARSAARAAAVLLVALLAGTGATLAPPSLLAQTAVERPAPQPRLPQVDIQAGMHVIRAEVAGEPATRQRGLMMRERLGPNEGMLFVFPDKALHCFWMRNTLIPLSIAFLDDDGTIVNILDMQPHSEDSRCPAQPVRYALEMEQGWFARKGLKPGTRLAQPRFFSAATRP
jgi:uncharacterized membrane protein (UPF0127 family)